MLEPGATRLHRLRRLIANNEVVIVLDGIDEFWMETIDALRPTLACCPGLRVIITTRASFGPAGTYRTAVAPLPTPPPGSDAGPLAVLTRNASVRLLVARLNETSPRWQLDHDNASAVATLCRRLDGIPLALELVAKQCAVLSIREAAELPATELLELADVDSAGPPWATIADLIGASCMKIEESDLEHLKLMIAFGRSWSLADATDVLKAGRSDVLRTHHNLLRYGMIRRLDAGQPARFEVLNLVATYSKEPVRADLGTRSVPSEDFLARSDLRDRCWSASRGNAHMQLAVTAKQECPRFP